MTLINQGLWFKKATSRIYILLPTAMLLLVASCCEAQINPFEASYFQNRYLANPAMAGIDKGLNINLDYQQEWSSFPGPPKQQSLTTDYHATDKVGLGLNINDEQEGLFRETRVVGTYAYHLPLGGQNQKLNFGLSLGFSDSRINYDAINGDISDPALSAYNQQGPYFDGDFGLSYSSNNLFIQAVLPNLNNTIFSKAGRQIDVDHTAFISSVSYKINLSNESDAFSLEPLAAYRQVKGFSNIFDLGFNFKMNDYHLDAQAIYHSNDNIGVGLVLDQPGYALHFAYNMYTGQINSYTNGAFEIGIRLKLFNK